MASRHRHRRPRTGKWPRPCPLISSFRGRQTRHLTRVVTGVARRTPVGRAVVRLMRAVVSQLSVVAALVVVRRPPDARGHRDRGVIWDRADAYRAGQPEGDPNMEARLLWPSAPERADLRSTAGTIVIDAADLDFIDRHSLSAVADYGERHDTTVVLRTRSSTPARLFEL